MASFRIIAVSDYVCNLLFSFLEYDFRYFSHLDVFSLTHTLKWLSLSYMFIPNADGLWDFNPGSGSVSLQHLVSVAYNFQKWVH